MRFTHIISIAALIALAGCSGSDKPDKSKTVPVNTPQKVSMTIPDGMGAIHITTGPYSPEIVSKSFYHMRSAFPIHQFEVGRYKYVLADSIATREVVGFAEKEGFVLDMDSVTPGTYNMIVYVSRLSKAQVMPDTVVNQAGDTTITDPVRNMAPYDYYFRPVFVDSLVVSEGLVTLIDLTQSLEKWDRPKQTDVGWEAARARYLRWDGATIAPAP